MLVDSQSWHARIYFWCVGYNYRNANLCPYVRTVLIKAPLKALLATSQFKGLCLTRIIIVSGLYALGVFCIPSLNAREMFFALSVFFALASVSFLTAFGMIDVVGWLLLRIFPKEIPFAKRNPNMASFIALLRVYARTAHEKICPNIFFERRGGQ